MYYVDLPNEVRDNLPKFLRLKRITKNLEKGEFLFLVVIVDLINNQSYTVGNVSLKLNSVDKTITWDTYEPMADILYSKDEKIKVRRTGIGTYVHTLILFALTEIVPDFATYFVCSNKRASEERLAQLANLGIVSVMPFMENLQKVLLYMERKNINVLGVKSKDNVFGFNLK